VKTIPLTKGKVAIVDDVDYGYLMQWTWHVAKGVRYAARCPRLVDNSNAHIIYMHRVVADRMTLLGSCIDHIDGNGLNNSRSNLRLATDSQNKANRGPQRDNTSGYKGVTWDKGRRRWHAQIKQQYRNIFLGRFTDIVDAAKAYNEAALKYYGEFAYLNPIP
jgi:hypothetical protein